MTRRVYGPDASCRPAPRRHHCVAHGIMVIAQNSPKLFDQSGSVCSREEPFTDCWLSGYGWFSPILVTSISWRCIHEANWLNCATRKKIATNATQPNHRELHPLCGNLQTTKNIPRYYRHYQAQFMHSITSDVEKLIWHVRAHPPRCKFSPNWSSPIKIGFGQQTSSSPVVGLTNVSTHSAEHKTKPH
jgi:hypothetical protein